MFAWLLAACGGGGGTPDSGPPDPDLPPLVANEDTGTEFRRATLDYACRGTRTRPAAGAPIAATFSLIDFQDDFEVPNAEVWLFTGNEIADDCVAPGCQRLTTDTMGRASVMLDAGGWYAYRVLPRENMFSRRDAIFGVFQYNEPAPEAAGSEVVGNSVSGVTIDLIPALLGISRTDGLAIVAGRIEDCAGGYVQNAIARIFDPDGNEIFAGPLNDDPHFHYFSGVAEGSNLPNQMETHSNADGLYVLVHVPVVGPRPYRVEAWGNLDGEYTLLSCEAARIFPDAVTILNLGPARADGPASCGG